MLEVNPVYDEDIYVSGYLMKGGGRLEGYDLFYLNDDGTCIGHVVIGDDTFLSGQNDAWAYITSVEVDKRFRGVGHGSKMMQEVMGFIKKHGYGIAYLYVAKSNRAAVRVYEKAGFSFMRLHGIDWHVMVYIEPGYTYKRDRLLSIT